MGRRVADKACTLAQSSQRSMRHYVHKVGDSMAHTWSEYTYSLSSDGSKGGRASAECLLMGRALFHRKARVFVVVYTLALHLLIFWVLARWGHGPSHHFGAAELQLLCARQVVKLAIQNLR